MPHRLDRARAQSLLGLLIALLPGCGDEISITAPYASSSGPNRPPTIVAQGPDFPTGRIDAAAGLPLPWVLVADPDGLDDISVVLVSVQSAVLHGVIARRDSLPGQQFCSEIVFNPNDTFPIDPLLPPSIPDVLEACPLARVQGGLFRGSFFHWPNYFDQCSALPRIDQSSGAFAPAINPCFSFGEEFFKFSINPPAVPVPVDVHITSLDVEYTGITATVYDAAGASATTSFPNLRVLYVGNRERATPP